MFKVSSLTNAHKAKFSVYVKKFKELGMTTADLPSEKRLLELFTAIYAVKSLTPPKSILIVDSPRAALAYLKTQGITDGLNLCGYGAQDAEWLSFYSFFLNECGLASCKPLLPLLQLVEEHVGWYWPFSETVIVSRNPITIRLRFVSGQSARQTHNLNGPAIAYADGFSIYRMFGVTAQTPEEISFITTPAEDISVEKALLIPRTEFRSAVLAKIGARAVDKLKNKTILDRTSIPIQTVVDIKLKDGKKIPIYAEKLFDYELIGVKYEGVSGVFLKMYHPSKSDKIYIESVNEKCKTVKEALSFRSTGKLDQYEASKPAILT